MTPKRLFLILSALLSLLLVAAPAGARDAGGGVAVQTLTQEPGGGVVAPVSPVAPVGPVATPEAEAAQQETTPTTPGGEEQPPDGDQTETETTPDDGAGGPVDEEPQGGGTGGETAGGLPTTGLELAALSMIGLGLLMAGLALRPTRSWPPPRDRLSRSMPRR
jgi:hypothetical protein